MNYKYEEINIYKIKNILKKNNICAFGIINNNYPYLIPMYYKLNKDCIDDIVLELYSSKSSNKINHLKKNDKVTILVQDISKNKSQSVIIYGRVYLEEIKNNIIKIIVHIDKITGRIYSR